MELDDEDVREILALLDSLPYDELDLQTERFRLTLRRGPGGGWTQSSQVLSAPNVLPGAPAPKALDDGAREAQAPEDGAAQDGLVAVRAPLPGTFYRAPRPGAPPFVEVGAEVDEDTVVAIVETMKLMNSVPAGVRGTIAEICLANAEFTGQDGTLMRVRPERARPERARPERARPERARPERARPERPRSGGPAR